MSYGNFFAVFKTQQLTTVNFHVNESYKRSTGVNYDSLVVLSGKLPLVGTTLESQFTIVECL